MESLEGIIPPQRGIEAKWMEYGGRKVKVPTLKTQGRIRRLREGTLGVQGALLWNSLPMQIHNYRGYGTSLQGFKAILGSYLRLVPDKPRDNQEGWFPNLVNEVGQYSNSLTHWRPWLQKHCPYYSWTATGEVRKASKESDDNQERLGEQSTASLQPSLQPSNPATDTESNLGGD